MDRMDSVIIVGTSGLARELTEWVNDKFSVAGFCGIDDVEYRNLNYPGSFFGNDVTPKQAGTNLVMMAIGKPGIKSRLYKQLIEQGFEFPSFCHPNSTVAKSTKLSPGTIIAPGCVVGPNVEVGICSYVNFCVGVGHDAQIGDFCQINPGAQIGGGAQIGNRTLVGSGASILENIHVGSNATIGSGASVMATVREDTTVMGPPARKLRAFG